MKLNRRSILGSGLMAPFIPGHLWAKQREDRLQPLDTGSVRIHSISPDGRWLMGSDDEHVVVLDAASLAETARSQALAEVQILAPGSVAWSPDSSRFTFSLDAWVLMRDSDIFLMDVASGELQNSTGEGHDKEADSLLESEGENFSIDMFPAWLDESTILFARHPFGVNAYDLTANIIALDIETGDISTWSAMEQSGVQYVSGPMTLLDEHRIAFWAHDFHNQPTIIIADDSGEVTRVDTDEITDGQLVAIDETYSYVMRQDPATNYDQLRIPLDGGEAESIRDILGVDRFTPLVTTVACGPEPGSFMIVAGEEPDVLLFDGSEVHTAGTLTEVTSSLTCSWVDGQILVAGRDQSWLVPVSW